MACFFFFFAFFPSPSGAEMKSDPESRMRCWGGGWDREERRCSSVWDIESRLLSRLCVCSLGRHGGGGGGGRGGEACSGSF